VIDFIFILSVTITTLGLITLGGVLKALFRSRSKPGFQKKLFWFPFFIGGLFVAGWLSGLVRQGVQTYLEQNVATSISGMAISVLVAWFLYDWVFWRKR